MGKSTSRRSKKDSTARDVETLQRQVSQHREMLQKVATKDDLAVAMMDHPTRGDLKKLTDLLLDDEGQLKVATKVDMQPILDLYKGSTFVKSFAAGAAAFIITLVAVGYAIITLVSWIRGTPAA